MKRAEGQSQLCLSGLGDTLTDTWCNSNLGIHNSRKGNRKLCASHDHAPHLKCSDCQYQTLVARVCQQNILVEFNVH